MADFNLAIPFTVPVLGEAFVSVNNPVLLTTLDFYTHVQLTREPAEVPRVKVSSPELRRVLERLLREAGLKEKITVVSQVLEARENDFLTTASIIYTYELGQSASEMAILSSAKGGYAFLTIARALTALAGGFTVVRHGEGAVSLDGSIGGAFHLSLCKSTVRVCEELSSFSECFPELAQPTWHVLGHIVLEGGRMVRESDTGGLGRLINLERGISRGLGLKGISDGESKVPLNCYGFKTIRSEVMTGELILAPRETLPLPQFDRFVTAKEGVREVG